MSVDEPQTSTPEQLRIAQLERENASLRDQLVDAEHSIARLRTAYRQALEQLQLLRHRIFKATAERTPSRADQLAFDLMHAEVARLEKALAEAEAERAKSEAESEKTGNQTGNNGAAGGGKGNSPAKDKPASTSKGRRDLREIDLPTVRIEVLDPTLEGIVERIGFDDHFHLGFERGGMRKVVTAVAKYKMPSTATPTQPEAPTVILHAPRPLELFRRRLLAPSMIGHLLCAKYMMGMPFYRLEQKFGFEGTLLDRGTMCRYAEDAGATLGAIVIAMQQDALSRAFCLSTDATGVSIQPGPLADRKGERGPCRKGHFFVVLADKDHVFFEFQTKHNGAVVCEMFKGFTGYIQADAHAIYDALFLGVSPRGQPPDPERGPPPIEVGCWSHCRRNFWEAAVCKHEIGREGLRRIAAIFAADAKLADLAPAQRKELREQFVRPMLDAFDAWVDLELARRPERGLVATALGYARNHRSALRTFLQDGRLKLDNNASERALRSIAVGRKAWLFFGSDDHANAAANLFSLIASCKLHGLDPERYLVEVMRVMPYWPRERYLELCPRDWARTRARLSDEEIACEFGHITVPPEEQRAAG